ncbi:glycoside hydrolase superfamily [Dactylonectria macrodidyma]|uniref:Glycoside hydrolase superfamily n=1 Tax=Dactylonectria macrodidyma TaxID=307937 RepID=A0A9P9JGN8_9HYPO|nr:glycoside hydrolase superfamily [Dactylonectria macrodidyma]
MPEEYMSLLRSLPSTVEEAKPAATGVATVNLSVETGPPQHLASGILYGIPDQPDQIPDHFYRDIGFQYGRGGGSQLPNTVGFARSGEDYKTRFASALSNYRTSRKHGGDFIYLLPAAWGADGGQTEDFEYPGDNGDWTRWDAFLKQTLADVRSSNMTEGLVIDIWNEPDLSFFWNRPKEQWLAMWSRTYHKIREQLPSIRITGPCMSAVPSAAHEWWTSFLSHVTSGNQTTLPDQWSWHMEGGDDSPHMSRAVASFRALLATYHIQQEPDLDININEYAVYGEQVPSAGAWWIAGLERENAHGLRGNWAIAGALHDFMAGLLSKPDAGTDKYAIKRGGYWPLAEYQVYKYYASVMRGKRLETKPTPDTALDIYATIENDIIRILAGTRSRPGNWAIDIIGLPDAGRATIRTFQFRNIDGNRFKQVDGPEYLGDTEQLIAGGKLRLVMQHDDPTAAFAFEVMVTKID